MNAFWGFWVLVFAICLIKAPFALYRAHFGCQRCGSLDLILPEYGRWCRPCYDVIQLSKEKAARRAEFIGHDASDPIYGGR
jgi:hypothetical protein